MVAEASGISMPGRLFDGVTSVQDYTFARYPSSRGPVPGIAHQTCRSAAGGGSGTILTFLNRSQSSPDGVRPESLHRQQPTLARHELNCFERDGAFKGSRCMPSTPRLVHAMLWRIQALLASSHQDAGAERALSPV